MESEVSVRSPLKFFVLQNGRNIYAIEDSSGCMGSATLGKEEDPNFLKGIAIACIRAASHAVLDHESFDYKESVLRVNSAKFAVTMKRGAIWGAIYAQEQMRRQCERFDGPRLWELAEDMAESVLLEKCLMRVELCH